MIKVLFVCHGNICRSPMAEMILKDMVKEKKIEKNFLIDSVATSNEEIGNDIYPAARETLKAHGINIEKHKARRITKKDYDDYDFIICMDQKNVTNLFKIIDDDTSDKVYRLLDFTDRCDDIEDPWYTDRFEKVYSEIEKGCIAFLKRVQKIKK